MKLRLAIVLGVIALLLACGCTGLHGPTGSVSISSVPSGADVYVDGSLQGKTPLVLESISAGVHHILIQGGGNSSYETDVPVTSGAIAFVNWTRDAVPETSGIPTDPVFLLQNMKGYRGGGDYITSISYDLSLAPGAKRVNISDVMIGLKIGNTTINPYWEITDKKQANTNDILEPDEKFLVTMRTPRLGPENTFTLTVASGTGQVFIATHTLPKNIGLDVQF